MYKIVKLLNIFFLSYRVIFTRFNIGPLVERVLKFFSNGSALMNEMAAMPIHSKNTKNLLLQNQEMFEAES